jgi:integrase
MEADEVDALIDLEMTMRYSLYAPSTSSAREAVKRKVTEFNQLVFGIPCTGGTEFPLFVDGVTMNGKQLSAALCARLFFAKWAHLKQSSLRAIRSQINTVYAHMQAGYVPWDVASGAIEAPATKLFIDRVIANAAPPQCHEPLDHEVFRRLVEFLLRRQPVYEHKRRQPVASLAFAACICILRGSGGRPQEAILLRKSYIRPNMLPDGSRDGFNIFFPAKSTSGKKISLKGRSDPRSRFKVMPERLEDGLHIANVVEDFLSVAPADAQGPLFQTVKAQGGWLGKKWSSGTITSKLQAALRDARMGLDWPEETVRLFTAHSLRATAATSMAEGGAQLPLVSTALNHRSTGVTLNHYIHFSKECVRRGLALTGTRGVVRHKGRKDKRERDRS